MQPLNKLKINLDMIRNIESSGGQNVGYSRAGALGPYQITPIALRDWNLHGPGPAMLSTDLLHEEKSRTIADWFFHNRLPTLLGAQQQITPSDILVAYNWGPGNARKWIKGGRKPAMLPLETTNYIKKYNKEIPW